MVNPALSMLIVVGLFVCILLRPSSTTPGKIVLLIVVMIMFGPISVAVMDAENAAFPWKFDHFLQLLDNTLGISAFSIARSFTTWQRSILFVIYETLGYWMIVWYALNQRFAGGQPRQLLNSYGLSYGLAPLFYLMVPACGPRHAFGSVFPAGVPLITATPVQLDYWPNAIPSLHLTSAILLVHFSGGNSFWRRLACLYLAGTAAATLAFEHYLIDLIVAVPYAYFVICFSKGNRKLGLFHLTAVLGWLLSIRFGTALLIQAPALLKAAATATLLMGLVTERWTRTLPAKTPAGGAGKAKESTCAATC
jgi:hypothetical protein